MKPMYGVILRSYREMMTLKAADIAERADMTEQAVYGLERSHDFGPHLKKAIAYINALHLDILNKTLLLRELGLNL